MRLCSIQKNCSKVGRNAGSWLELILTAGDFISVEIYRNPDLEGFLELLRDESRREAMGSILWVCGVIEMSAM